MIGSVANLLCNPSPVSIYSMLDGVAVTHRFGMPSQGRYFAGVVKKMGTGVCDFALGRKLEGV